MINILIYVARESNNSTSFAAATELGVLRDLRDRLNKSAPSQHSQLPASGSAASSESTATEFTLTQEDFMMWSVQSTVNLVQPFLDLLFEVCHVVLGLRPQCRHLEYDIGKYIIHLVWVWFLYIEESIYRNPPLLLFGSAVINGTFHDFSQTFKFVQRTYLYSQRMAGP